jgi:kynurenine formamidase
MAMVQETLSRRRVLGGVGVAAALAVGVAREPRLARAQDATPTASPLAAGPPANGSIALGPFTTVQDLTHSFGPGFPVFPGTQQMAINVLLTVDRDGYYQNELVLNEHTGTHMDAPAHFDADGLTADALPVENLVAPLVIVDISERAGADADAQLTPDDIVAWETAHGPLPPRALVAMYSGWEARLSDPASYVNQDAAGVQHYPGFHPEAAAMLVEERDIVGIGVDTLSQDYGASTDFGTHITICGAGKYGMENVAALASVPPAGAIVVIGGPKHETASGGPSRVLAFF